MEFFYQIKIADNYNRPVATQEIVEAENKKEVIKYLETEYPEYFDGNKVAQKLSKKSDQVVYVSIYELTDYWRSYWTQEIECCSCHRKVKLIEIKNHLGYVNLSNWTCSLECEESRKKKYEDCESETDEYYSNLNDFYFIYKITNKNTNEVYIGYTSREPIFRWWEHYKHSHLPIGMALKEQGIESFTFEVLEKHNKADKTIEEMHEIETKYMKLYDSIEHGYNCVVSKSENKTIDGQISLFDK